MNLVEKAKIFATSAHAAVGQLRKYSNEPYIVHPIKVMETLISHSTWSLTDEDLAIALLHDVVEDTKVTVSLIKDEFGPIVAEGVDWLTNISKPEDGNRATRIAIDLSRTSRAPARYKSIRLADAGCNAYDVAVQSPSFAKRYLPEKYGVLMVCRDADPGLFLFAKEAIQNSCGLLGLKMDFDIWPIVDTIEP